MESDESLRRKRRVAFILITLIFVIADAALIYWAVNIATARLDEDTFRQVQMSSPRTPISDKQATLDFGHLPKLNGEIKVCRNS